MSGEIVRLDEHRPRAPTPTFAEIAAAERDAVPDLTWAKWALDVALAELNPAQRRRLMAAFDARDSKRPASGGPRPVEEIVARTMAWQCAARAAAN